MNTPSEAVEQYCRWCFGGNKKLSSDCGITTCELYLVSKNKNISEEEVLERIKKNCLDCAGTLKEVVKCNCFENKGLVKKCSLYPFRLGKPTTKRK